MKTLAELAFTVSLLSAINALILMLAPDRYRREIKAVLSLIIVASVFSVISGADFTLLPEGTLRGLDDNIKFSADIAVQRELENKVSEYIGGLLDERGIEYKNISVETSIDADRRIFITKASLRLSPQLRDSEELISSIIEEKIGKIDREFIYEDD